MGPPQDIQVRLGLSALPRHCTTSPLHYLASALPRHCTTSALHYLATALFTPFQLLPFYLFLSIAVHVLNPTSSSSSSSSATPILQISSCLGPSLVLSCLLYHERSISIDSILPYLLNLSYLTRYLSNSKVVQLIVSSATAESLINLLLFRLFYVI